MYQEPCCDHHFPDLGDYDPDQLSKGLAQMVEDIWKNKGFDGTINKEVTSEFAKQLYGSVLSGYGENFVSVDYDTPDFKMLASLRRNVWQFSAAKNYQQGRELTNALIGDDGKQRSKKEWLNVAANINDDFNRRYGSQEYDMADAGATMAAKWADIDSEDILEYDAVMDSQTTELCGSLNGTRLPASNEFWDTYYPPNHWGPCRSTVRVVFGMATTPYNQIPGSDIPPMFRTNLGKQGLIFPPEHSYYKDIPEGILNQAMSALRKELFTESRDRLKGKSVKVKGLGEIGFTSDGMKEIFNQPHNNYMLKNQLAFVSDQLLENSRVIGSYQDTKGRGHIYHYLEVKGLEGFYPVVKEFPDGRKVLYSIVDKIK